MPVVALSAAWTRLQTDWLDIVLGVHSDGNDLALIENGVFDVLQDLKSAGMIRAMGCQSKRWRAMRAGGSLGCGDGDLQSAGTSGLPVIAHAHQQGKRRLDQESAGEWS